MYLKALIVDDEKKPRELLRKFIPWEELGIRALLEAEDGEEALLLIQHKRPDIIISDIKMPLMNGLELAEEARRLLPECRFVFLSGYPDKEYLKGAIRLRVDRFVEKPIDPQEITEVLRQMAGECRLTFHRSDPRWRFFRNDGDERELSTGLLEIGREELQEFGRLFQSGERETTLARFRAFCRKVRAGEATEPAYIQDLFSQIVLQLNVAADLRGAVRAAAESERLLYSISRFEHFSQLECETERVIDIFLTEVQDRDFDPVSLVNHYLEAHYTEPMLTVDAVARALNFSVSYLCSAYKHGTGRTINQQLTLLRITLAKQLLTDSNQKLYEVARQSGYSNPKYFTRLFTKETGQNPRKYRESHRHV